MSATSLAFISLGHSTPQRGVRLRHPLYGCRRNGRVRAVHPRRSRAPGRRCVGRRDLGHALRGRALWTGIAGFERVRPLPRVARARPRPEPGTAGVSGHPQDLSLREQASAVAGGELDPAELLDATLTRIAERNGPLNAFIAPSPADSRAMLAAAPPGPLRGVPIAVKDIFTLPWWAPLEGTAEPNPAFPAGESGVYRRLRDAGAV